MKIRKKPVIVDAWEIDTMELQYQGNTPDWVWHAYKEDKVLGTASDGHDMILRIRTLEGIMSARDGDILVKGVRGELYAINRAIFEETYDVVEESEEEYEKSAKGIEVMSMTENPDGSSDVVMNMDYDSLVSLARLGVITALENALVSIEEEYGIKEDKNAEVA